MGWRRVIYTGLIVFCVALAVSLLSDPWQQAAVAAGGSMLWLWLHGRIED